MNSFKKYFPAFILLICVSCVRKVDVPVRDAPPVLVVEGSVTTDSTPYTIQLSYSGKFTNTYQASQGAETFISDAKVSIVDDLGDSTSCTWVGNGTYQSADSTFIGKAGRSYSLKIYLANGKTYISKPEKIQAVPAIDSITVVYDSTYITDIRPTTQLIVSTNLHDTRGTENYYRWTSSGYYPRKSWGGPCTFGSPPCTTPYACTCFAFCEQFITDNQVNVLSDRFIDGNEIQQPVFYSPIYWRGIHFIEIKQASISKDAYLFWQLFLQQTNRTGSILDPLPASLIGNIYNAADSNDLALGYFTASDIITKKVRITPFFLQTYFLAAVAGLYILPGDCHAAYPNTLNDDQDAPGWEDAEQIDMH